MIPTRRLFYLALVWLVLGVLASRVHGLRMLWVGFGVGMAVIVGVDFLLNLKPVKGIEILRRVPDRFALGKAAEIVLEVRNVTARALDLQIYDGVPRNSNVVGMPWRGAVPAKNGLEVAYPLTMMKRGVDEFSAIRYRVKSRLGWWWRRMRSGGGEEIKVYPDFERVLKFSLLASASMQGRMGIIHLPRSGQSREFRQLREYRVGDPLRQIDWKATSRHLNLISREYSEQRNQTLIFVVDTGRRMRALDGDLPYFDHCLNAMLLVSYIALEQGDRVGIQSFGGSHRWLPPQQGRGAIARILNHLFDYQTTTAPSDFQEAVEAVRLHQARRALVVILTAIHDEDKTQLLPAVRLLSMQHLVVVAGIRSRTLTSVRGERIENLGGALKFLAGEAQRKERERVFRDLRGEGINTVDARAEDLPQALANRYLMLKSMGML